MNARRGKLSFEKAKQASKQRTFPATSGSADKARAKRKVLQAVVKNFIMMMMGCFGKKKTELHQKDPLGQMDKNPDQK